MAKTIDLGRRMDDLVKDVITPVSPERPIYPDLYISDLDEPALLDLPNKGEARIKFRVVHRRHEEHERDGKKSRRCSVRLEITSIELPEKKQRNNGSWLENAHKSFKDNFK